MACIHVRFHLTVWSMYKKLTIKFLTEGKRINRVPSKISMPPNIASGTLIRTVLKVLFLYILGSKVLETGKDLSMSIMLCKFARQFIFHIVVPFFWYLHCLPFWQYSTGFCICTYKHCCLSRKLWVVSFCSLS